MDLNKLKGEFPDLDIEWRVQRAGTSAGKGWAMVLAYVTNRAIQERLDDVVGAANWKNEYKEWHGSSQLCGISIKVDNEWVTKWDGADATNIEATKGGLSDAMKRAAVQWGMGRYLYKLEATFVSMQPEKPADRKNWKTHYDKDTNKTWYWREPKLSVVIGKDPF
jgi:hypothetical protein